MGSSRYAQTASERLRVAFLDLMREKPFEKIKVVEITNRASLSRKTFYDYYSDIHDLAYDCFREFLCGDTSLRVSEFASTAEFAGFLTQSFAANLDFCRDNPAFAKMVYEESHYSRYLYRIVNDGILTMVHSIEDGQPVSGDVRIALFPNVDLVARVYFMSIGMIVRDWIDRGMDEPVGLVARRIAYMACHLSDIYGEPSGTSTELKGILLRPQG